MHPTLSRLLHLLGATVGIVGVAFVVVQLYRYWGQIDPARLDAGAWSAVAGLTAVYAAANLMLGLAWWSVLSSLGIHVSKCWAIRTYGLSQIAKYVPGNVIHLAGRQALGMAARLPAVALLKSAMWELALIATAGGLFALLIVPLLIPDWPAGASVALFAVAAMIAVAVARRLMSAAVAAALLWQMLFLIVTGCVFVIIIAVVNGAAPSLGVGTAIAGAYVVAWLAGLVTPGAPAGVGVRELVLLSLLGSQLAHAELLIAVVLARMVTVVGDLLYFVAAARSAAWQPQHV